MRTIIRFVVAGVAAALVIAGPAHAQTFNSGSTGADGAFTLPNATCPTAGVCTIALPPSGVFNYTTFTVPAGWTLRFVRNAANTPVTVLTSGNVSIAGNVEVNGANGNNGQGATFLGTSGGAGGPGGFDGGNGANGIISNTGGNGLGPGAGTGATAAAVGGVAGAGGGGHLTAGASGTPAGGGTPGVGGASYSSPSLLPLIGGSGGGGGGGMFPGGPNSPTTGGGGGGGGGAILIASSGTIAFTSFPNLRATGGSGGFSFGNFAQGSGGGAAGGAIRLLATTMTGQVTLTVAGGGGGNNAGAGSFGRIRIEAYTSTLNAIITGMPPASMSSSQPTTVALTNTPTLRIASVGGVAAPASPTGSYSTPDITLPAGTTSPVTVDVAGANIPLGTVVTVTVAGLNDASASSTAPLSGTVQTSSASTSVAIPTTQPAVISASATFILANLGGGPVYADGEEVDRVRVAAAYGGASRVTYITKSGREVAVSGR